MGCPGALLKKLHFLPSVISLLKPVPPVSFSAPSSPVLAPVPAAGTALLERYREVRAFTERVCAPLQTEDYVVQPVVDVSPPKWHLGHTTWFFETFLLVPYLPGYKVCNEGYNYVFNSYYETIGARVVRTDRGNLSRPSVQDVYSYRKWVDTAMEHLLQQTNLPPAALELLLIGFNHEEQHAELLLTDIKFILGNNPLLPVYNSHSPEEEEASVLPATWLSVPAGTYEIGATGTDVFCFDNELNRHKVYLNDYAISDQLISNAEYLSFIEDGGYRRHEFWHAEGWDWVAREQIGAPMYWHLMEGEWHYYTLGGLKPLKMNLPVGHLSFYEASAFAAWRGARLPTEAEWEVASDRFSWGQRWEWTASPYVPYPGFKRAAGAIGEYNGKFMVSQMVLRGASLATPPGHSRATYRNFFHPHLRWQYTGLRLVRDVNNNA